MPYTLATAPDAVKKLPHHAQEIWVSAWNNAYANAPKGRDAEEYAFRVAWAAVRKYREDLHSDFKRILDLFVKRYGDEGDGKFQIFIKNNKLDFSKPYNPLAQFGESFQWIQPLIQQYKKDKSAKYYRVVALTANISMNNNDYSDYDQMKQATPSLAYRPVNINHNHALWLPFPRNRVDFVKADDFSVEATLRIDNKEKEIQDMIDKGEILHPSIEGRPDAEGMGTGYHFTGLALLKRGAELPGDPLTEIKPLMLNESVHKAVCGLINGKLTCRTELNKRSDVQLKEQFDRDQKPAGPIPPACICPECGEVVENPKKHCALLKCPECGHQMRAHPPGAGGGKGQGGPGNLPEEDKDFEAIVEAIDKEAVWDYAYKAALPDSAYAYIESGCEKSDGKTIQRCRHMPIKSSSGEYDAVHVRAALVALRGGRTGKVPPYASKAKPKICAGARALDIKSEVCGTAESKEDEDKIVRELFRPPFGDTEQHPDDANKRFAKTKLQPIDTSTPIAEKLVEAKKEIADLTDKVLKLEKKVESLEAQLRDTRQEKADLQETVAKKEKQLAKNTKWQAQVGEATEKFVSEQQAHEETKGILDNKAEEIVDLKKRVEMKDKQISELRNDIGTLKAQLEDTRNKLHESLEKTASSNQKAINETQNRARIQNENAMLREKNAELTREISDLSEQRSKDAKKLLKQEQEIKEFKEQKMALEKVIEIKDKALHDAVIERKKDIKIMKKAGFVKVKP